MTRLPSFSCQPVMPLQSFFGDSFEKIRLDGQKPQIEITKLINELMNNVVENIWFALKYAFFENKAWFIFPSKTEKDIQRRLDGLEKVIIQVINERIDFRLNSQQKFNKFFKYFSQWVPNDFIDIYLDTYWKREDGKNLSIRDEIVRNFILLFFAGIEIYYLYLVQGTDSTSHTMDYLTVSLAMYPEIQEQLRKEVNEHVPEASALTMEQIKKLEFCNAFLKETMRCYNISPGIVPKVAINEHQIGTFPMTKSWVSQFYQYNLMNPFYYENPEEFDIQRWIRYPNNGSPESHPFIYIPFSAGARNCVGQHLANLEAKILLVFLLKQFELSPNLKIWDGKQKPKRQFNLIITLQQKDLICLTRLY